MEYEAPDYCEDGVAEFFRSIGDPEYIGMHAFYGAFERGRLIGVVAARNKHSHIALLFVERDSQRQGIGRALINHVKGLNETGYITVNSSPFGHGFYQKVGFADTDVMQVTNGIAYYPMRMELR